jgi:hypothetical protein
MAKEVKGNPEMVRKSPYHTVIDHLDETCACAYKKRPLLDFLAEVFLSACYQGIDIHLCFLKRVSY